jgi:hypothetical protein
MLNSLSRRMTLALQVLREGALPGKTPREIPSITNEEITEAKVFFPLEKFFIFGHARSGTTVLARLARLHPEVHCNYQAHFFTRLPLLEGLVRDEEVGSWLSRGSNRWNRGKDLSPVVLRAAADFILEREARKEGKHIVGDKSPSSLMDGQAVRQMHKVYPDARLVYIVRDGRDTVISHRIQAFIDFPDRLAKEDLKIRRNFSRHPEPYLQGDRYHSLRYEDLMERAWEELTRLWEFLGAGQANPALKERLVEEMEQNLDANWQQQKAKEITQTIPKGKPGSWKEIFTPRDKQIFFQVASETLKTWGYLDNEAPDTNATDSLIENL